MIDSKILSGRRGYALIFALMAVYIVVFVIFTIGRYERYNATGWDLGIFTQLTWNAAHGRFLQNTLAEYNNMLAIHAPYITVVLAPLFWIWSDPRMLLIAQTVILAAGAWPIARLAGRKFSQPWIPVLFAGLWLLYPSLGWINRWDFHEIAPATTFFAFAFEAADRRAWRQTDVWLILALLCKEEIGMNVAFFAVFAAWQFGRSRRASAIWFVVGVAWFFVHAFIIFPTLRHAENGLPIHAARYSWLLSGNLQTIWAYISGPDLPLKFGFFIKLFFPVAFICMVNPKPLIAALPTFAFSLLSSYRPQFDIYMHYTAPIIPAIMVSSVYSASQLNQTRWLKRVSTRAAITVMLGTTLIAWTLDNPILGEPGTLPIYGWDAGAHLDALREVETLIPPDSCVVAENNIEPQYSVRAESYVLGARGDMDGCKYMIVDLADRRHDDFTNDEEVACYQFWSGKRVPIYYRDSVVVLQWAPVDTKPATWQQMQDYCNAFAQAKK